MVSSPYPQGTSVIQGSFSKHISTGCVIIPLASGMTVCCCVSINLMSFVGARILLNKTCFFLGGERNS